MHDILNESRIQLSCVWRNAPLPPESHLADITAENIGGMAVEICAKEADS